MNFASDADNLEEAPGTRHELICLAAVEALGRIKSEPALAALRTAEQPHASPAVRKKAKETLAGKS